MSVRAVERFVVIDALIEVHRKRKCRWEDLASQKPEAFVEPLPDRRGEWQTFTPESNARELGLI